jgi:hypothetical protein
MAQSLSSGAYSFDKLLTCTSAVGSGATVPTSKPLDTLMRFGAIVLKSLPLRCRDLAYAGAVLRRHRRNP